MKRRRFLAAGSGLLAASFGRAAAAALPFPAPLGDTLATRAERTQYRETSLYADVVAFLDELDRRNAPIFRDSLATTAEGRSVPYVVASRPIVRTPQEARRLQEPVVFILANVRGGDVAGKEALLAFLRDMSASAGKTVLDDVVLVIVPLCNPDGNERLGPQTVNRPGQNGPELVGIEANGAGLDLARDWMKAEAPETRGLLRLLERWEPDVFVDLQCAAGSFTNFSQLQTAALHPATGRGAAFARERLLPAVRAELRGKSGIDAFVWGHFGRLVPLPEPPEPSDVENFGWFAHDYRPRFAFNYAGLRGAIALMNAADAHDPFERRIAGTRAFVQTTLDYCAKNDVLVMDNGRQPRASARKEIVLRAALPERAFTEETIEAEQLALSGSPAADPGVPAGYKRTGTYRPVRLPLFDRYVAEKTVVRSKAYLIPYECSPQIVPLLRAHGIAFVQLVTLQKLTVSRFVIESVTRERLSGTWSEPVPFAAHFGAVLIDAAQRLGTLAAVLLEPESDDGLFSWNAFAAPLEPGADAPVLRVVA